MDELKWQPFLNASEIGVSVKDGIVRLSGTVNLYSKKLVAENAAKNIHGVRAVVEEIDVRLTPDARKSDVDLAAAVFNALKWHSAVQEEKIKIKVEDGWVTLDGEVEWEFQKNAARSAIENLTGVKGVFNHIMIAPRLEAKDIKRKIESAFQRNASIDADKVKIETVGDKIILRGTVRSWAEKKDAEYAAWLAPGVRSVENKLNVESEIFVE